MTKVEQAKAQIERELSPRRLSHVLAVVEEMGALCDVFDLAAERDDLLLCALLHDVTKEKSVDEQLQMCRDYGIILSAEDRLVPKGLHAITAAALAEREYGLSREFTQAIRFHTTARVGMTLFDELLFLADYIEQTRTYPTCVVLRRLFWEEMANCKTQEEKRRVLSKSVRRGLDMTLQDLLEEERFIHPDTAFARNDLLKKELAF